MQLNIIVTLIIPIVAFILSKDIEELSCSLEICSEAPYFRDVWPSDITFHFNNIEVATYKSPGDFGGRQGKLTPSWWPINSTQFGLLKTISINSEGSFLDFVKVSDVTINDIKLNKQPYLSIKIEIKDDAKILVELIFLEKSLVTILKE